MVMVISLVKAILVACVGAFVAKKLKFPVPNMIGAMLAVAVYNILTEDVHLSGNMRMFIQIINGAFIGSTVHRADVFGLKKLALPVLVNITAMLSFGIIMGAILAKITPYAFVTTVFASAPGGLVDMPLIGHDFGADVAVVALLQLVRMLTAIAILPIVLKTVLKHMHINQVDTKGVLKVVKIPFNFKHLMITLLIGFAAGGIGVYFEIPAGGLVFAMIACATFNVLTEKAYMPKQVKSGAQILAGMLVGSSVTLQSVLQMKTLLSAVIILSVAYILLDFLLSFVFIKFLHTDVPTALFANAPGGVADMALIAVDYGANMMSVALIQTVRMCGTIMLYPLVLQWFL